MKKLLSLITLVLILSFFLFTTPCPAKQMNILVYPFENTGNNKHSWISAGMTDSIISDLTRIQNIEVVSNSDRIKILNEMKFILSGLVEKDKMMKLGKLTGAHVIFTGSYLVAGDRIRVHARLVNVETGKVENSTKIDGTLNGIFDLQDKIVFTLMGNAKKVAIPDVKPVLLTEQDKRKIEEKPKVSLTAYEWYAKGLELNTTDPKKALTNFNKALDNDPNFTDALMQAGLTAGDKLDLFSEALVYLEKADQIFKSRNETQSAFYAKNIDYIGVVFRKKGQLDRALEYYSKSQSIYESLGLQITTSYAVLLMHIGLAYEYKGQSDRALEYYSRSQSIYETLGLQNTTSYAILLINIGLAYRMKQQLDLSLKHCLNAQSIYDYHGLQNTFDYANILYNIGIAYRNKRQLDHALEYYLKSQSIFDNLGLQNASDYANVTMSIGLVYMVSGQLDRALGYCLKSQSIFDTLGLQHTSNYAIGLLNIAILYEKKGQSNMAGKYYRESHDTFVRAGYSGKNRDIALNNAKRLGY